MTDLYNKLINTDLSQYSRSQQRHICHMTTAANYARLSTCVRLKVGCIIAKDRRVVSLGYNGMPEGESNVCEIDDVTKDDVIHAEENALLNLVTSNENSEGADIYCTHAPCKRCAIRIAKSKIRTFYYVTPYRSQDGIDFLIKKGINCVQIQI